jgi:hypothetical protein
LSEEECGRNGRGFRVRGAYRQSACASSPCYLCVTAALSASERNVHVGASPPPPCSQGCGGTNAARAPLPPGWFPNEAKTEFVGGTKPQQRVI